MAKQSTPQKGKQATPPAQKQTQNLTPFVFDKTNYLIMIAGVVVIMIGFMLMSGGGTSDPNIFPKAELYSFRRITLAPIVVMIGFGIGILSILKKPSHK